MKKNKKCRKKNEKMRPGAPDRRNARCQWEVRRVNLQGLCRSYAGVMLRDIQHARRGAADSITKIMYEYAY